MALHDDPWTRIGLARIRSRDAEPVQGPAEPVCATCRAEQAHWIDAPATPAPIRLITIGSDSHALDSLRLRAQDHYERIRTQQALIASACRTARHSRLPVAVTRLLLAADQPSRETA